MTSKIKHLQFVKLYLSTHVTNTKSMTPNQLRHRASSFKGFRHTPLGPCWGFKAKLHDFIFFLFLLFVFFFFLLFLFFSFLEDNIGLQMWAIQTYPRLPTYLRSALKSERRYTNSQPNGTTWCAVCELALGRNFQVEHAGTAIDQKLTQAWNEKSNIKVINSDSILQQKAIQLSNLKQFNCSIEKKNIYTW